MPLPLTTLLSQALVAFTIEFDDSELREQARTGTNLDGMRRG
jgi:hypothetical protein